MPGSITYTLSLILALVSWTILDKSHKVKYFIVNLILVVIISGTNEISMLLYNGSLILYFAYYFIKNKKIPYAISVLLLIGISCMTFVILAPGNTARSNTFTDRNTHDFVYSIVRSVYRSFTFTAERLFIFIILAFHLLSELKVNKLKIELNRVPKSILIAACVIFPFAILCFGIFPSYYASGKIPPERTVNTIAFFFMISIVISIIVYKSNFESDPGKYLRLQKTAVFVLIGFIAIYPNELRNNIYDLLSGRSSQFKKEMESRIEYITNTKEENLKVKKITVLPITLLFKDITKNEHYFLNNNYTKYYNKKSIATDE